MSSELDKIDAEFGVICIPEFYIEYEYKKLTVKEKFLNFIEDLFVKIFAFCEIIFVVTIVTVWMSFLIKFFLTR